MRSSNCARLRPSFEKYRIPFLETTITNGRGALSSVQGEDTACIINQRTAKARGRLLSLTNEEINGAAVAEKVDRRWTHAIRSLSKWIVFWANSDGMMHCYRLVAGKFFFLVFFAPTAMSLRLLLRERFAHIHYRLRARFSQSIILAKRLLLQHFLIWIA